jgi:adenosine deaminase
LKQFICTAPKAELHLHIDGSLQAARMLALAKKNQVALPYQNTQEIEKAYNFTDLQSFLDLYYLGASVLRDEEDFYHLMMDYLVKCREQNIVHSEIMVEPQTYFPSGVSFATMMAGFRQALKEAEQGWGQSALLILSLLRHLSEEEALDTLDPAEAFREDFVAIGLASSEKGNPPEKFKRLYATAKERGYLAVAHAGEEGPPQYIWDSLNMLGVARIDHGVRCVEDPALVAHLAAGGVPLTVCPLSNVRLCVFERMEDHTILKLLAQGVKVGVNSDDPTYFGGFLNENYLALVDALGLNMAQARQLLHNSFEASFLTDEQKRGFIEKVDGHSAA